MVRLVRPAEPVALTRNRQRWTSRWQDSLQQGRRINWATSAALATLKAALSEFSFGKCAFCESILGLTSYHEVEHYQSKVLHPLLAFDWQNLFPSCRICNGSKGELEHAGGILRPDLDDPETFLWLNPNSGELQPHPALNDVQQRRVLETIDAYNLQRGALCEARIEMMQQVLRWLHRIAGREHMPAECREEWLEMIRPTRQWKFVLRHVLSLNGQVELAEIDRRAFLGQPIPE